MFQNVPLRKATLIKFKEEHGIQARPIRVSMETKACPQDENYKEILF
jgi:hypothetical protein